jgi:hypothetical protein
MFETLDTSRIALAKQMKFPLATYQLQTRWLFMLRTKSQT